MYFPWEVMLLQDSTEVLAVTDTHTVDTDTETPVPMLTLLSQSEVESTSPNTSATTSTTEISSLLSTLRTVLMQLPLWTATPEQEPTFTDQDTVVTAADTATDTETPVLI